MNRDTEGYKDVVDASASLAASTDFDPLDFRDHPEIFHFIIANDQLKNVDIPSLKAAQIINAQLYKSFTAKGSSYDISSFIDAVECRHILMMTVLADLIGTNWGNVVELGAGYGNWLRLADGIIEYSNWTVIDHPFVLDVVEAFLIDHWVDLSDVSLVSLADYSAVSNPTVVIGTQSLSEFSMDDFEGYINLICQSKWLFYASHNSAPSEQLLKRKQQRLREYFDEVAAIGYEGNASTMYLFKRKETG